MSLRKTDSMDDTDSDPYGSKNRRLAKTCEADFCRINAF